MCVLHGFRAAEVGRLSLGKGLLVDECSWHAYSRPYSVRKEPLTHILFDGGSLTYEIEY